MDALMLLRQRSTAWKRFELSRAAKFVNDLLMYEAREATLNAYHKVVNHLPALPFQENISVCLSSTRPRQKGRPMEDLRVGFRNHVEASPGVGNWQAEIAKNQLFLDVRFVMDHQAVENHDPRGVVRQEMRDRDSEEVFLLHSMLYRTVPSEYLYFATGMLDYFTDAGYLLFRIENDPLIEDLPLSDGESPLQMWMFNPLRNFAVVHLTWDHSVLPDVPTSQG